MRKVILLIQENFKKLKVSIEKLLDKIFDSKITHIISIYLISIFLVYIFSDRINNFIREYLTIEKSLLIKIPKSILYILFGFILIFIIHKLVVKRYQPSLSVKHSVFSFFVFYCIIRFTNYPQKWSFIIFTKEITYIDFLGSLSIITTLTIIIFELINLNNKKLKDVSNVFVSDDPITNNSEDKLEYEKRVLHIISYIEKAHFDKSFTIGIVGPWGNGKSSFISLIEEKLNNEPLKGTIHLRFLPYLNHSEKDIISEFFKQLSSELNKHSGKLSNEFISYSNKLLKLYENKNVFDFFKPDLGLSSDLSAHETYDQINKTLNSLNKKYIIFIDDLDRLSSSEILQILKLVRNTANFKNFIFLIALDKDYILETLMTSNDISDHSFINKFFQLEIYLPEINKSQLKSDFITYLEKSPLSQEKDFVKEVSISIYKQENLFDDYISNYRDVKRLINQLIFDYNLLPDKLNTNDFLNFTYLKMTFPFAIKYLNRNWQSLIPYNSTTNLCELKENVDGSNGNNTFNPISLFLENPDNEPDYDKYEISKNQSKPKTIGEISKFTYTQNLLLSKTLIYLFGKENVNVGHTSIKFENNFRKLLQQKILETDLNETTFETIFDFNNDFKNLREVLDNDQVNAVLNRIAYLNSDNQNQIEDVVIVLLNIFDKSEHYNISFYNVWDILVKFIIRAIKNEVIDKKALWKSIFDNFINSYNFKIEKKIEVLSLISEYRIKLSFDDWGTEEQELKTLSLELYKNYVKNKQTNWKIDDFNFYMTYHSARKLNLSDEINPIVIEFLNNEENNIELICAQITDPDSFTVKKLKTSGFADNIFGSKEVYFKFIEKIYNNKNTPGLKEYLNFLNIERISGFSTTVRFEFVDFVLMKSRIDDLKSKNPNYMNDGYENVVEIVLMTSSNQFKDIIQTNINQHSINGLKDSNLYYFENKHYLFISIKTGSYHQAKTSLFKHYQELLKQKGLTAIIATDKNILTVEESGETISIYSVQPKSYDNTLKT